MKLNLGCGRTRKDGWVNVDMTKVDGVTDVVCDLDGPDLTSHFAEDSVDESVGEHVIEHLSHPLEFMTALWRVTKPGGTVTTATTPPVLSCRAAASGERRTSFTFWLT